MSMTKRKVEEAWGKWTLAGDLSNYQLISPRNKRKKEGGETQAQIGDTYQGPGNLSQGRASSRHIPRKNIQKEGTALGDGSGSRAQ